MKIIGDIGNTEVKICLVDNKFNIKCIIGTLEDCKKKML